VADVVAGLRSIYDAPPGEIETDVLRTLREFAAEGLIDVCVESK